MGPILKLDGLTRSFGAVKVADGLGFELSKGQALGVIGPNGAGKTSMFNLVTGTLKPDGGRVYFNGADVTALSAARRSRSGMARSFQIPQPFTHMTVFENAMVAATQAAGLSGRRAETLCLSVLE
ncbi:MAG: ATP-binding cassette domain-containing protein, partial [Hyphomicrobiaceae bacterium]